MQLIKVDPRALKENPDRMRQTKSTPQADALLLATIKAVGIVQPPVITPETGGGNGYVINAGHRRVKQAIAAGLEEIDVLVDEAANDNGAMRSIVENIAREALNPVDQWRAIERLVALGWTEEAIGVALALPVRQIRKLRLLANVLPAMLDHMAKGDMPNEQQLRTIAAASLDEQKEVWKKHRPSKADPQVSWWSVAQALQKTRMHARHASFGEDLAQAYGIHWVEDLFAPADEDSRYTTDVEAFLGAQQEWMANNLPKKGLIAEATNYGEVKLPPKAERVFDDAPIGSIVAWSDGTPQPPARFRKKLAAWQSSNSRGRLIRKQGGRGVGNISLSACFTLHEVDYGVGGVIAIRVHRTFSLESKLHFTVVERPAIGSVRVLDRSGDDAELVHLATNEADAKEWLTRHGYPHAVLEEVTADDAGPDIIEGRTAA